jgi:hypothetical protein
MARRLRIIIALLGALVPLRAGAVEYWMWEVIELRSYGEQQRDLVRLLVPWLAKIRFYDATHQSSIEIEEDAVIFADPDGDFVGITGRYNCISIAYYTTPAHMITRGLTGRERSDAFEAALTGFLQNLPTPRVTQRIVAGTQTCGDAI